MPRFQKPMSTENHSQLERRSALTSNRGKVTQSFFVPGVEERPNLDVSVERTGRQDGKGNYIYEVRLDLDGFSLGERALPPGLKTVAVTKRLSAKVIAQQAALLEAFIPDHLEFIPTPTDIVQPRPRQPKRQKRDLKYNTTIFGADDRAVFRDTSYPWSAFGRCETNFGPFSGVMIGPRHILTCNHGVDWTPPPGYDADWLTFTPAYYDGTAPFGSTYATHVYYVKKDNNDGFSNGDEDQYDYTVLVLNDRIGDRTGWLGTRRYTDAWDPLAAWWHIGYPQDLTSLERPTFQSWFTINGDDNQDDAHEAIYHEADVFPGQSGGAVFGFWTGDVGPRAVAVQSWQNTTTNGASGGGDLVDLAIRARSEFP